MKSRVGRAIFAVLFLIGFGIYVYKQEQIHSHSVDVESWGEATGMHPEGFDQGIAINDAPAEPAVMEPEETEAPEPTPEPTPEPPQFDMTSWALTLVNGDNSIGTYEPEKLAYLNQTADETDIQYDYNPNRCPVDERIAQDLLDMALACKEAGYPVYLSSGYRSYTEQQANFTRVCNNNGVSDGKDANGHYITMPAGCSEHQLALCCDITDVYHEIKNAEIENTDTFKWLSEHCTEYGFVHRFPSGKEDITGVMYEPFHFRYVGVDAAKYMKENNLCLEEFWELFGE